MISKEMSPEEITEAERRARVRWRGDCAAVVEAYSSIRYRVAGLHFGTVEGMMLLCLATSQGHRNAAANLGRIYGFGHEPVDRNNVEAYKWYAVAATLGDREVPYKIKMISKEMTAEEIAEAERRAREWRPGDCEGVAEAES